MSIESEAALVAAERRLRAQIEEHRAEMSRLGKLRAALVAAEVHRRGRTGVAEVAAELELSQSAIRRLVTESRRGN